MSPSRGHLRNRRSRRSTRKSKKNGSAESSRSGILGFGSTSEKGTEADYDSGYVLRQRIFMLLVVVVLGLGVCIVVTSMHGQRHSRGSLLSLSETTHPYTVLLKELPESQRQLAQQLSRATELRSLAGEHKLFVMEVGQDRIGLCVGNFKSKDTPALKEMRERFSEFTCESSRPFKSAQIYNISE